MKDQDKIQNDSSRAVPADIDLDSIPCPICSSVCSNPEISYVVQGGVRVFAICPEHSTIAFIYDVKRGVLMTSTFIDIYKPARAKRKTAFPRYGRDAGKALGEMVNPGEIGVLSDGLFAKPLATEAEIKDALTATMVHPEN